MLPGSIVDLVGVNPPYSQTFQGGLLGTVGGTAIAPWSSRQRDRCHGHRQSDFRIQASRRDNSRAPRRHHRTRTACLQPVAITAVPDGKLHAPYFMEWSFGLEHQIGKTINLRAQYVGTRAVNQPYTTQVNGYQTVCQGCFAPFPYGAPTDPRFGAVTQLATGANSHYNALQTTAEKRLGHGLQVQANYTWSHCIDTVSNGGFLPFSAGGILSPIPGDLQRDRGPCDYDVRHNFHRKLCLSTPDQATWPPGRRFKRMAGIRVIFLAQWTAVFGAERALFGQWKRHRQRRRPAVRQCRTWRAVLRPQSDPRRHSTRHDSVAESRRLRFDRGSSTGACVGGENPANCQFGNLGRNALRGPDFTWSDLYLTKWFALGERMKLRIDGQFFNLFNHPNFGLPALAYAGVPGQPSTQTGFGALTSTTSPPTGLLGVGLGGDSSPRMIAFQARLEF